MPHWLAELLKRLADETRRPWAALSGDVLGKSRVQTVPD
jgi:hypothetical protein